MYARFLTMTLLAVTLVGWPGWLAGQEKTSIDLFNEGSDLAEQGKLEEAVALWVLVADEIPDKYKPTVQVNLGLAYKKLGRLPEAWHHLSRYLATREDAEVEGWRAELERELGKTRVRVSLRCQPHDATVHLQSAAGNTVAYRCPLVWWFEPGSHTVRVEAAGYKRRIELLQVKQGGPATVVVELESLERWGVLVVEGDARAVQVFLDGKLEGSVPFRRKLKPGNYELMVGAPGKMPWRKAIVIEADQTVTEAPEIARKAAAAEPVPEDPLPKPPEPGVARKGEPQQDGRVWAWTLVGAGALGLAGGATLHGLAWSANEDLRDKYPDGTAGEPQPLSNKTKYDDGYESDVKPLLIGAGVLYGVGAAAAIAGTVWMVVGSGDEDSSTEVAPLVAPGAMGLSFEWNF